jgi:hypothetical protein
MEYIIRIENRKPALACQKAVHKGYLLRGDVLYTKLQWAFYDFETTRDKNNPNMDVGFILFWFGWFWVRLVVSDIRFDPSTHKPVVSNQ